MPAGGYRLTPEQSQLLTDLWKTNKDARVIAAKFQRKTGRQITLSVVNQHKPA